MINILICSINRWNGVARIIKGGRIKQGEGFFTDQNKADLVLGFPLPPEMILDTAADVFKKHHYRFRFERDKDNIYATADKNRYFKLGTFVSHLSIILLVLAYISGSTFGFRETNFIVMEGQTEEVGYDTGLSLNLISFTDEYYDDGTPSDYRSEVVLYKDGREVSQAVIRVNHPLSYQGIRFYQSFFGPVAGIQIVKDGDNIFSGDVDLSGSFESYGYYRYLGYIYLEEHGLFFDIISSAFNAPDPMIPFGKLAVLAYKNGEEIGLHLLEKENPLEIEDIELTYLYDAQYSGFQVRSDPGNALVWIACTLFIVGLIMVFYFPHRQMWLLIKKKPEGRSQLYIRVMASRAFNNDAELKALASAIESGLGPEHNTVNWGGRDGRP